MGVGLNILFWIILGGVVWAIYSVGERYFARCAAKELEATDPPSDESPDR